MSKKPKKKRKQEDDSEGDTPEQCRLRRMGLLEEDDDFKPQYSTNPNIQAFFDKHGDFIRERGTLLFKDGATLQVGPMGYGFQQEPPEDKHELAKLRLRYVKSQCKKAETKFRDYKGALLGQSDQLVWILESTEEQQEAKLKLLRTRARKARERLRKAQKRVEDMTPAWITARKRDDAERKRKEAAFKNRLHNIQL